MVSKTKKNTLIISLGYLPTFGGSYRVLHELIIRTHQKNNIIVLTCKDKDTADFDKTLSYKIVRSAFISILSEDSWLTSKITMNTALDILYFRFIKKIFKYLFFPLFTFCYLVFFLKSRNIKSIIFAQSVLPFAWYIILFKKITNLRITTFVYGEDIVGYRKKGSVFKYLRKIYLRGLYNTDYVIVNSSITKNECLSDGISSEKIKVIYPAVDYNFFKPLDKKSSRALYGIKNQFVILSVGRLIRRKGFDTVLDVLPAIRAKIPNIIYIICGEGYDKEYLISKTISNNITDCVKFLEKVSYNSLPNLYSAADIFVLPNRLDERDNEQEGFGIVFLEANACGIPVIGGDSGGVKDIIENGINGFLVNPYSLEDISNKIFKLFYSKSNFTNSSLRNFIMKKYKWDDSAKYFQKLL